MNQFLHRGDECLHLGLSTDGDAEVILEHRLLEIAHEYITLLQFLEQLAGIRALAGREYEIRLRIAELEANESD